jgi:CBS domain-containing protein
MKAGDIMTAPAVSVTPETGVREIALLLTEKRIGAVPVLDAGRLAGIVSRGDLLRRHEIGVGERPRAWWARLFAADMALADYVRSHARVAEDIMSRDVVWVSDAAPLRTVAAVLESQRVRRVPVVHGSRLAGIISRGDLVRALPARMPPERPQPREDADIRRELLAELARQPWWRGTPASVTVVDGVVHYRGTVKTHAEREAARLAAQNIAGVRGVEDHRPALQDMPMMV